MKLGELRGQFIIFANRVAHHMEEPSSTDQQEIIKFKSSWDQTRYFRPEQNFINCQNWCEEPDQQIKSEIIMKYLAIHVTLNKMKVWNWIYEVFGNGTGLGYHTIVTN